ncbi:Zinc finger PHD-type protein [Lasiodiplodia theobromae]|nr:Zinc finger PHD-type protein [Lasiodiplodia theobromae]
MAVPSDTPTRRNQRGPGRPPRVDPSSTPTAPASAPPKRPKYIPGGPGGGGRYIDPDTGAEIPKEIAIPLLKAAGRRHSAPRPRPSRTPATIRKYSPDAASPSRPYTRPRRDRPAAGPRASSASAAAAAVAQNDGYKPREERGWEEFHQDLDIDAEFMVFSAEEVDGISPPVTKPTTPVLGLSQSFSAPDDAPTPNEVPALKTQNSSFADPDEDIVNVGGSSEQPTTPTIIKRRPGRPPRRPGSMLTGLGSPPAPRIEPLPTKDKREKLSLPKPSYRTIDTFSHYEQDPSAQVNYVDRTMASVGYQESDMFIRPEKRLIRIVDGNLEEDLDLALSLENETPGHPIGRVEYDMDEQDDRWLEAYNAQRKEEQVEAIKPAIFEITMTQIEKEWHALEKRIPKPNPKPPQTHRPRSSSAAAVNGEPVGNGEEQDTKCAVCDDGDCENTNAIVFCDGCDLAVHQECYGVPFIPEGQWLCRKCQLIGRGTPTCIFCPNVDGAFKQTANPQRWSHLLCAIWIPEVSLGNTTFMEPVMDVEKVPKQRWKLQCYICDQKMGACIQCGNKNCYSAFHVTCARRAKLFLRMKSAHSGPANVDASVLKAFCHKHVPNDWRRENDVETATREAMSFYRQTMRGRRWAESQAAAARNSSSAMSMDDDMDDSTQVPGSNKRKRSQSTKGVWRLPSGAPVVPQLVYEKVEGSLVRFNVRKRKEYVAEACKYWTLKREARRGAALLKRLQLQMETFSSMEITRRNFAGMGAAGRPRLHRRIEFAELLEKDMEKVRDLCRLVKEREEKKLDDVDVLKSIVDIVYFPIYPLLWPILEKAQSLDSKGVFKEGLDAIEKKLEERFYTSVLTFSGDIAAVFRSVLGIDEITDAHEVHEHLNDGSGPHGDLTPEQKDKKKLAKRIMKAIHPTLEDATVKEAQIAGKPYDQELRELNAMLDGSGRSGPTSAQASHDASDKGNDKGAERPHVSQDVEMTEAMEYLTNGNARTNGLVDGDRELKDHDAGKSTGAEADEPDHEADDAAIRLQLQLPEETTEAPAENSGGESTNARQGSIGTAPALSNSGSTHPSTTNPDPLTPPQSDGDALALSHGGVPWYLQSFDPRGTTIYDEVWSGREVVRGMSEELSEIDDAELDGMLGDEEMVDAPADSMDAEGSTVQRAQRAKARVQQRRNASRRVNGVNQG